MNSLNIPNFLTIIRIILVPVINYLFWKNNYDWALAIFTLAGFSDFLDGIIARNFGRKTKLGAVLDPAADKFLMTVTFITFSLVGAIPIWLTVLVIWRDIHIIGGVSFLKWQKVEFKISPTLLSKWNTFFQLMLLWWVFILFALQQYPEFLAPSRIFLKNMLPYYIYLTAITTLLTGLQYTSIGFKIFKNQKKSV